MQANGSRPRGLTVLVPFCVGIWGSVGQSHPPRPLPDVGTHIWGGSRPQIQGKGHQGGGGFYPKKSWGGNTASSSAGAMGQEGRPAARPSLQEPKGEGKFQGGFFFFFFWHFPVIYVAAICGSLGDELPRQRQLRVRVSVRFFGHAAARLLTRLHLGSLPCAERGTGKEQGGLNTRTREKARPGQGRVGFGFGFGDGDAVRRRSAPRAGCPAGGCSRRRVAGGVSF